MKALLATIIVMSLLIIGDGFAVYVLGAQRIGLLFGSIGGLFLGGSVTALLVELQLDRKGAP